MEKIVYKELSYKIVGLAMEVQRQLGHGFLEKVYENALILELKNNNIQAQQKCPIKVYYKGEVVGEYIADILVEEKIILELKTSDSISDAYRAQIINYLKATEIELGILINFGTKKLSYERFVNTKE
jgi:GxxExxY protein